MQSLKHYLMFIQIYLMQSKRKWLTFPLLLLSPIIIIGATLFLAMQTIIPEENEPIEIGIINEDQSEEISMLLEVLMEAQESFEQYVHMDMMEEVEAIERIERNELAAYVIFPRNFIEDLFYGEQVTLEMVGNKSKQLESIIVKEIVDSVMRHINTSQANILMINSFAKDFIQDNDVRNEYLFEQFISFFMFTMGKDKIVSTNDANNLATSAIYLYYGLSAFFILSTIWLWTIYLFLQRDETTRMETRIRLYGVTLFQQTGAKITVTLLMHTVLAVGLFYIFQKIFALQLELEDYGRLFLVFVLYSLLVLIFLVIIELLIKSLKTRLLLQLLFILFCIVGSGAVIPVIYFPLYVQEKLAYIFSYEALFWLQDIILNGRLFAEYDMLIQFLVIFIALMLVTTWVKGRRIG